MINSVYKSVEARDGFRAQYRAILNTLPFEQKTIDTAYGQTFLLCAGDERNPPIVLLHGSVSNSVFMSQELTGLSAAYRVYAVDLIGECGLSSETRPDISLEAYGRWLVDVLDELSIDRAVVAGNSLGGFAALSLATMRPDRVEKLILLAPGGLSAQNDAVINKAKDAQKDGSSLTVDNSDVAAGAGIPDEVVAFMNLILSAYNPITASLPIFTDDQLRALTMPVLYVSGTNDRMLDAVGAADRIRTLVPDADVRLIDGAGHVITNAVDYIRAFLEKETPK